MATRQRILDTARALFNAQGLHRVGVRDVARAAEMSPGNLAYHFATKDDLVAALVMALVERNERTVFANMPEQLTLPLLYSYATQSLRHMLAYRCLLLSPLEAWTASPPLAKLYVTLTKKRRLRHEQMLHGLIVGGALETTATARSEILFEQSEMISSGWLTAAMVRGWKDERAVLHFAKLGCALLEPHCTQRGARDMRHIINGDHDA